MRNAQEKITGAVQALPPTFNTVYSHASDISFLDEQVDLHPNLPFYFLSLYVQCIFFLTLFSIFLCIG